MMKNALANAAVPRRAYVITQCNNLDVYILHAVVVNIFLYTAGSKSIYLSTLYRHYRYKSFCTGIKSSWRDNINSICEPAMRVRSCYQIKIRKNKKKSKRLIPSRRNRESPYTELLFSICVTSNGGSGH